MEFKYPDEIRSCHRPGERPIFFWKNFELPVLRTVRALLGAHPMSRAVKEQHLSAHSNCSLAGCTMAFQDSKQMKSVNIPYYLFTRFAAPP
jgi:hypothetical protein